MIKYNLCGRTKCKNLFNVTNLILLKQKSQLKKAKYISVIYISVTRTEKNYVFKM